MYPQAILDGGVKPSDTIKQLFFGDFGVRIEVETADGDRAWRNNLTCKVDFEALLPAIEKARVVQIETEIEQAAATAKMQLESQAQTEAETQEVETEKAVEPKRKK